MLHWAIPFPSISPSSSEAHSIILHPLPSLVILVLGFIHHLPPFSEDLGVFHIISPAPHLPGRSHCVYCQPVTYVTSQTDLFHSKFWPVQNFNQILFYFNSEVMSYSHTCAYYVNTFRPFTPPIFSLDLQQPWKIDGSFRISQMWKLSMSNFFNVIGLVSCRARGSTPLSGFKA